MHYYMGLVLAGSSALWLWDTYLHYRQHRVYLNTKELPPIIKDKIDEETFAKSRSYSVDKSRFGFVSSLYDHVQTTVQLCCYLTPWFWDLSRDIMTTTLKFNNTGTIEWEIFQTLVFTFVTSVAGTLLNLPISIYSTFVIEEKHGFNKQTAGFYAWDQIKKFSLSYVIMAPVSAAIIYIVKNGGPYFFMYLWGLCMGVSLILNTFHGQIAALFDTFTALPPGKLRDRIEILAGELKFAFSNIFVVEGSKRSSHSNAYLSGLFNKKRIVIYDTLIEGYYDDKKKDENETNDGGAEKKDEGSKKGCNNDEIIAVLCHELGHWSHNHTIKNLIFMQADLFLTFVIFSKFYNDPTLYSAFGFHDEKPVLIGLSLLMTILTPYNEFKQFISTLISRHFEYQADNFAKKMGHAEDLKTALVKLHKDNLGFPVYDELYSSFNHSHPTLIQRLKALGKSD